MDYISLMTEVSKLEERFLKADEKLDEIPKAEEHDKDEQEEVLLMGELIFNAAQNAFELIRMLKKRSHTQALEDALGQQAMSVLETFSSACESVQEALGELLYSLPDEEEKTEEPSEEPTEEPAPEEKPTDMPEEQPEEPKEEPKA